jgi:hypothetical protein
MRALVNNRQVLSPHNSIIYGGEVAEAEASLIAAQRVLMSSLPADVTGGLQVRIAAHSGIDLPI